jgi:2-polyprenyl-3-methyl-5-hydroxy-6-metoxy-1,4-benzoquinol methylase
MIDVASEKFRSEDGVLIPRDLHELPNYEFNQAAFDDMLHMQREHFWYRGRHRFLLRAFEIEIAKHFGVRNDLRAIDLGGGCGGWIEYLAAHAPDRFAELALADGSLRALTLAGPVVGERTQRYCVDMLQLPWSGYWDVVFMLDVLEHVPDHLTALQQVRKSLKPGGLAFVAVPALQFFWSYNDELAGHQRRYNRNDFGELARQTGMDLVRADYFMFFLSPALFLSRMLSRPRKSASAEEIQAHLARSHGIPARPLNSLLGGVFSLESRLIDKVRFPWGTSILAVLKNPSSQGA